MGHCNLTENVQKMKYVLQKVPELCDSTRNEQRKTG